MFNIFSKKKRSRTEPSMGMVVSEELKDTCYTIAAYMQICNDNKTAFYVLTLADNHEVLTDRLLVDSMATEMFACGSTHESVVNLSEKYQWADWIEILDRQQSTLSKVGDACNKLLLSLYQDTDLWTITKHEPIRLKLVERRIWHTIENKSNEIEPISLTASCPMNVFEEYELKILNELCGYLTTSTDNSIQKSKDELIAKLENL